MVGIDFPVVSSNLKAGYGVWGTADPYDSTKPNNGALNPPGSIWYIPTPSSSGSVLSSAKGYGSGLWVKYVLYKSTSNPAMVAGPAPVYYTDTTFATVSGTFSEGVVASKSVSAAGWLLPNTGSVAGIGVGSAITATILNNATKGSWVFIALSGVVASAYLAAGAVNNWLYGSGDFATTGIASDGATTYQDFKAIGISMDTVSSNIGTVLATVQPF